MSAFVQHMSVNHGRIDILVPQQLLNGTNVISVLQQMGRKRMSKSVTANMFNDSGLQTSLSHSTLHKRFVNMMTAFLSCLSIFPPIFLGEHPLPPPFLRRIRILAIQCIRHQDAALPRSYILFMDRLCLSQVTAKGLLQRLGQHGNAIFGKKRAFGLHEQHDCSLWDSGRERRF